MINIMEVSETNKMVEHENLRCPYHYHWNQSFGLY